MTTTQPTTPPRSNVHPELAAKLLDEAARLRERARDIMRAPTPAVPGTDRTQSFADLWAEAWKKECGVVADRLADAARVLEIAASATVSPTHDLLTWRRG